MVCKKGWYAKKGGMHAKRVVCGEKGGMYAKRWYASKKGWYASKYFGKRCYAGKFSKKMWYAGNSPLVLFWCRMRKILAVVHGAEIALESLQRHINPFQKESTNKLTFQKKNTPQPKPTSQQGKNPPPFLLSQPQLPKQKIIPEPHTLPPSLKLIGIAEEVDSKLLL